jgi:hypothetical protein
MRSVTVSTTLPGYVNPPMKCEVTGEIVCPGTQDPFIPIIRLTSVLVIERSKRIEIIKGLVGNQREQLEAAIADAESLL